MLSKLHLPLELGDKTHLTIISFGFPCKLKRVGFTSLIRYLVPDVGQFFQRWTRMTYRCMKKEIHHKDSQSELLSRNLCAQR